jgi:glucosamine--fructose-6-phosphate aminotransferase (isomerizing)
MMGKGNYRHFMLKEIYEQPAVIGDTLRSISTRARGGQPAGAALRLGQGAAATITPAAPPSMRGMVAVLVRAAGALPVEIDVASRATLPRAAAARGRCCASAVSQSGETADTLAACATPAQKGQSILSS